MTPYNPVYMLAGMKERSHLKMNQQPAFAQRFLKISLKNTKQKHGRLLVR